MTDAAQRFVTPMTFAALTGRKVLTDLFAIENAIDHIGTAQENDLLVVARLPPMCSPNWLTAWPEIFSPRCTWPSPARCCWRRP